MRQALRGIGAGPVQSISVVLGVLIGVAAVMLLVAVGNGRPAPAENAGVLTVTGTALSVEVAEALEDPVVAPGVTSVAPVVSGPATLSHDGAEHRTGSLLGTTPDWFTAAGAPVGAGVAFTGDDEAQARRVVVIGPAVAGALFGGADPVGRQVTIDDALFTVTGVLREGGDVAVAPLSAVRQVLAGYGPLSSILVRAGRPDTAGAVRAGVAAILDQRLGASGYRLHAPPRERRADGGATGAGAALLAAAAVVSLLVGGLGITQIMLLAVTERTREIGIRKALGAPRRVILGQFLAESALLGAIGGGLGVAAAVLGSRFEIAGVRPVIVPGSVALALGVSVLIGLVCGGLPAARAARLRPADALRYE